MIGIIEQLITPLSFSAVCGITAWLALCAIPVKTEIKGAGEERKLSVQIGNDVIGIDLLFRLTVTYREEEEEEEEEEVNH